VEAITRVVLLTDFGTADGYAAAMAGVIAAAAPGAAVEHASHDIAPGDVFGAALALSRYARLYPPETIHLVVVDPGVGTARRGLAARIDDRYYVAPDNGVLSRVLTGADHVRLVTVERAGLGDRASPTFHGRDIFAPAAAHLARGGALDALGDPVHDPFLLETPEPTRDGMGVRGQVIGVDRFGTLITNIPASWIRPDPQGGNPPRVTVGGADAGPVRRTYADVEPGELVALIGSLGLLEVSVRDGSAARCVGEARGAAVEVRGRTTGMLEA
jgi:S-adenosyl-L-methionine hydrolase (adenosine-forming)